MRAMLDTHTFLWWNADAPELSDRARDLISDGRNEIYLSAASAWEIAIKHGKGRLELPEPPEQYVVSRMARHGLTPLPIQVIHALRVNALPHIHSDPFDRLLVAQSQADRLPLLTADAEIARYDVVVIW
jgi:PIN domain nuclease of toxin-antitoxin system